MLQCCHVSPREWSTCAKGTVNPRIFKRPYLPNGKAYEEKLHIKIDQRDEIYAMAQSESRSEEVDERSIVESTDEHLCETGSR